MEPSQILILLIFVGALFIIGFAILMGMNIGKKQGETHCPYCKETIQKGIVICPRCGKEIPAEEK